MSVERLIEVLATMPRDAEVWLFTGDKFERSANVMAPLTNPRDPEDFGVVIQS